MPSRTPRRACHVGCLHLRAVPLQQPRVASSGVGSQETDLSSGLRSVDAKLIPAMPTCNADSWKSRPQEIIGFHAFLESLTSWLSTLAPAFGGEVREVMVRRIELLDVHLNEQQHARAQRLFFILKQALQASTRCVNIIKVYESG